VTALKNAKFKITPQRLAVVDFVSKNTLGHFTAEQVFKSAKENEPTITLATTYNALYALEKAGALRSFELKNTTWFESRIKFHANFICNECGKIYDIEVDEKKLKSLINSKGFDIENMDLIISGTCKNCLKLGTKVKAIQHDSFTV
jgi:Fe2+ or Zn2+ uptake regulation protein